MHTTHTQLIMHETLTPNASAMIASELPKIQFANSDNAIAAPNWFTWGLHFGQQLAVNRSALESGLVLVTAPCESALLGAISLGTLSHLLEIQSHNHGPEQHFESLFQMPVGTLVKRKAQTNTHTRPRVYRLLANRSRENGIKMKMVKGPQKFKDCIITLTPAKALLIRAPGRRRYYARAGSFIVALSRRRVSGTDFIDNPQQPNLAEQPGSDFDLRPHRREFQSEETVH